ncbi:hypothetical protein MKW92_021972 [Papaver armeniacum]|nr:hypothetical protein MKW92_021972 [Papaver armeniacum]
MALKNVAKLLSQRWFSSGTTSGVIKNGGGIETKNTLIRDDRLRSMCERLEQAAAEANQLRDECNAIFALKRVFTIDQILWGGFIVALGFRIGEQFQLIKDIKDRESQLSALRTKKQELQLPA